MNNNLKQTLFWLAVFIILALLPLAVAMVGPLPSSRTFWVEFGALLGFLGLAILCLQCVITGRFRWFATGFGLDNLLQFHKQTGIFALLLILAHPAILFIADRGFVEYLDPRVNLPRAISLSFVTVAAIILVASSLWRITFGLSYERWRLLHGLLSFGILFLGLGHIVMVDHYSGPLWKKAAFVVMSGSAMYLIFHSRVVRPLRMRKRPYRIREIRPERNESWTMCIEAEGHPGMDFRAGQFCWLTVGDSPFSMQQHPFSIASSPTLDRIELTAKELGDFTGSIKDIPLGTRAWLEGPYGSFVYKADRSQGAVFIAGGVGITPLMSMLRNARDNGDKRPFILFYGNTNWEEIIFREEIEEMPELMNLKVVHVLEKPDEDWSGEKGFIDREVFERHLPDNFRDYEFFVCGPIPMMDATEPTLRELRVAPRRIHSERFDMV